MEILSKKLLFTRLETRTKESNTYASLRVEKPLGEMKVSTSSQVRKDGSYDRPGASSEGFE